MTPRPTASAVPLDRRDSGHYVSPVAPEIEQPGNAKERPVSERILLVEDDPAIRESYAARLRERYDIDTACDAAEALVSLRTVGPYAVVISDQHMPPISCRRQPLRISNLMHLP